jgi:hypothetical protein
MHFGDRLCDVLGDAETIEFAHFVFRVASGLRPVLLGSRDADGLAVGLHEHAHRLGGL